MKTKRPTHRAETLIGALCWTILLSYARADDWLQYLGPNRNSTSAEKGILRSWPVGGPQVLWTVSVGKGFGGPVVKGRRVYLLDRDDAKGETLRCLDLADGKELWQFAMTLPAP